MISIVIIFVCPVLCLTEVYLDTTELREDTLLLTNIIFRHGDRTPDQLSLWPSNPFYDEKFYMPYGYGELTNQGKRTEFLLGLALKRGYSKFLGKTYNENILEPRSTDYSRTKMSLQLVLAGLFSSEKKGRQWWPRYKWRDMPYKSYSNDQILQVPFICTKYQTLFNKLLASKVYQAFIKENQWVLDTLSNNTGIKITNFVYVYGYYYGMLTQDLLGFPLEEWTRSVYPDAMKNIVLGFYYAMTNNTALRRIATGYLLKKIISDAKQKINGTTGKKMYLYSGHEYNVANILSGLDLFNGEIPNYGSYVIIELHKVNGNYGFQLLHQNYRGKYPKLLTLPGCTSFCPFDKFVKITKEIIPGKTDCN